jgi:hypothetical protein
MPLPAKGHFLLAGLLAFFSGTASLGHQLLWMRRLVDVLGRKWFRENDECSVDTLEFHERRPLL